MLKVAIVMGSENDFTTVKKCVIILKELGIQHTVHVLSAHRAPDAVAELSKNARSNGYGVIIAAAGKAAHLAGCIAANTTLPVIGIPIKSSLDGMDALLSTVQMPAGVPVATVAIDGAENAALLAAQMLSLTDNKLANKLAERKKSMLDKVMTANENITKEVEKL